MHYIDEGRYSGGRFEVRYGSELKGEVLANNTATLAFNEYLVELSWCHSATQAGYRANFTTNLGRKLVFARSLSYEASKNDGCTSTSTFTTTARHQYVLSHSPHF